MPQHFILVGKGRNICFFTQLGIKRMDSGLPKVGASKRKHAGMTTL